jgi:hypothetical protein
MSGLPSLSNSQLLSYFNAYTKDEQWPQDSEARCEVAKSVVTVLEKNSARLTIAYLPLIEQIVQKEAFTEYPIYKTRVLETYKTEIAKYVPATISVAAFIQLQIANEFVIAFYASQGSPFYIACMTQTILQLANSNLDKGRLLLGYFLETASAQTQKQFFAYFTNATVTELRYLFFETTYPHVKTLCFANPCEAHIHGDLVDDQLYVSWEIFCVELIASCPNIQTLHIEIPQKGNLPEDLVDTIAKCSSLEVLDISHFYISDPFKTLMQLSALASLKKLSLQVRCTSSLLKLPAEFLSKIDQLCLRYEHHKETESPRVNEKDSLLVPTKKQLQTTRAIVEKCTGLTKLRAHCALSLKLEHLELVLDPAYESEHSILGSNRASLKKLSFFNSPEKKYSAEYATDIVQKCSNISSIQAARLLPGETSWFDVIASKQILKELAMQVYSNNSYIQLLPALSSQLSLLHLKLVESAHKIDLPNTLTHNSKLTRLMLEVGFFKNENFFAQIAPFLYATNPEELVLIRQQPVEEVTVSFLDEPKDSFFSFLQPPAALKKSERGPLTLNIRGEKLSLEPLTRLKRLILCSERREPCWKFSKEVEPYVYTTFEVELLGHQLFAYAIDLENIS